MFLSLVYNMASEFKTVKIKISETVLVPVVLYACEIWSLRFNRTAYLENFLRTDCWWKFLKLNVRE